MTTPACTACYSNLGVNSFGKCLECGRTEMDNNKYCEAQLSLAQVCDLLVGYVSNGISATGIARRIGKDELKIGEALYVLQQEWDEMPCDPEGATKEQEADMDRLLEIYAQELLEL
jgi:hypothetical protein